MHRNITAQNLQHTHIQSNKTLVIVLFSVSWASPEHPSVADLFVAMFGAPALPNTAAFTAFCWSCTSPTAAAAFDAYSATALEVSRTG